MSDEQLTLEELRDNIIKMRKELQKKHPNKYVSNWFMVECEDNDVQIINIPKEKVE